MPPASGSHKVQGKKKDRSHKVQGKKKDRSHKVQGKKKDRSRRGLVQQKDAVPQSHPSFCVVGRVSARSFSEY